MFNIFLVTLGRNDTRNTQTPNSIAPRPSSASSGKLQASLRKYLLYGYANKILLSGPQPLTMQDSYALGRTVIQRSADKVVQDTSEGNIG